MTKRILLGMIASAMALIPATSLAQTLALTPGTISTIAGTGTAGQATSGSAASSSKITTPYAIAVAPVISGAGGDIYYSQSDSHIYCIYEGGVAASNIIAANSAVTGTTSPTPGDVYLIAGNGTAGITAGINTGSLSSSAEVNASRGLAVDSYGNLFIAQTGSNALQVIYAGNISAQGTNPAANLIELGNTSPSNYTNANLTSSSTLNGWIFNVAGTGSSYTNAGPAYKIAFNSPRGIYVDAAENVYIADDSNNVVKVLVNSASNSVASFLVNQLGYTSPIHAGAMYIIAGGESVSTYPNDNGDGNQGITGGAYEATGTYTTAVNGPASVGVNPTTNDIYIAEAGTQKVRKITFATGVVSTVGGPVSGTANAAGNTGDGGQATAATFDIIRGMWVDAGGNIYLADASYNTSPITSCIRKIDAKGYISTVAGTNGVSGSGAAVGDGGNATNAELTAPFGVVMDAVGNLIVADTYSNRIRKVTVNSSFAGVQGQSTTSATQGYSVTSDGTFVFGNETVGTQSSTVTALISNISGSSVTPTITIPAGYVQVTGGTSIEGASDCSGSTAIAAGHTCMLELAFDPITGLSAGIADNASVTVAASGDTVSVPMTGTGTTGSTASTTTLAVSPSSGPYNYGSSIIFTATVTSGATGNVYFYDGSTLLGTVAISGTTAVYSTSSLSIATHSITATYAGNATYASSTSSPALSITVQNGAAFTSTVLTVLPTGGSYTYLTSLTFTATVSSGSGTPNGTVTFSDTVAGTLCSSVTLNGSGVGTCTVSNLAVSSSHSVTAVYAGTSSYQTSTSNTLAITITNPTPISSTTTITSSGSTSDLTSSVTLTVSVTGGATNESYPTGTVTLTDTIGSYTVTLGTLTLSNGAGSLVTKSLPFGSNSISGAYSGDLFYNSSSGSSSVTVTATRLAAIPGVISTELGNGTSGTSTTPTGASMSTPTALRVDAAGNIYFADYHDIVRVYNPGSTTETIGVTSVPAGQVVTIAGTSGTACATPSATPACGDTGVATSATLNVARGLAVDPYGNVYISDAGDNRIRVLINSAPAGSPILAILTALGITPMVGDIYTIAGNGTTTAGTNGSLATSQGLNSPRNILLDNLGNVYIANINGNKVQVLYAGGSATASFINAETTLTATVGDMYTIAGSGSATDSGDGGLATAAGIDGPSGLAFDASGNLLVMEYAGGGLRRINFSTGIISLAAGTENTEGFAGDGGAATSAQFNAARDLWVDWAGNIYISDFSNDRVRMINSSGIITTVAGYNAGVGDALGDGGPATSAFINSPQGAILDNSGNLVITDYYDSRIRSVSATSGVLAFPTTTVNATNTLTAVLSNNGSTSITFTSISSPPTGYAQTASGGTDCYGAITLASGQSCNLQVPFTPTAATSYTGTVTVASNAATVSIALSGYGGVPSTTTLTSSSYAVIDGGSVALTAAVTGSLPTGVVNFYYTAPGSSQQKWFATGTLTGGTVTTASTALPAEPAVGSYTFTAVYLGDANNAPSTSSAVSIVDGATATTITGAPATATASASVTLTVAVTGLDSSHNPSGMVTLTATPAGGSPTTLLNAVALVSQAASYTGTLPVGTDTITAIYSGNSYNATSTATTPHQQVPPPQRSVQQRPQWASVPVLRPALFTARA